MNARRLLRTLAPLALLVFGGAYALASWNWCGRWEVQPVTLAAAGLARGELRAGAARAVLAPPYPVVAAGYNPPRPEVTEASTRLEARAVVLEVPPLKVGLVSVDLLLVPDELAKEIREKAAGLGLSTVIVAATHAHSSMGAFDERLVSQLAGTGRFRRSAQAEVAAAAVDALTKADEGLAPALLASGEGSAQGLVGPRSGDAAEEVLQRVSIRQGASTLAELWVVAAHPTLVARPAAALSPDYPGLVDPDDGPVTIVLQGAVGNASASVPEGEGTAERRFADALAARATAVELSAVADPWLGFARAEATLPRPDASRLAPWFARAAGDNLLCSSASKVAEVSALRLGDWVWVALPLEPSFGAAQVLRQASGATRVLSLVDGYAGYVEPAEVVKQGGGEARRQYFGPALLDALTAASRVVVDAVRPPAPPSPP